MLPYSPFNTFVCPQKPGTTLWITCLHWYKKMAQQRVSCHFYIDDNYAMRGSVTEHLIIVQKSPHAVLFSPSQTSEISNVRRRPAPFSSLPLS